MKRHSVLEDSVTIIEEVSAQCNVHFLESVRLVFFLDEGGLPFTQAT